MSKESSFVQHLIKTKSRIAILIPGRGMGQCAPSTKAAAAVTGRAPPESRKARKTPYYGVMACGLSDRLAKPARLANKEPQVWGVCNNFKEPGSRYS